MEKTIDCLIIGHNEVNFEKYVNDIKNMGINTGAYRDLNLSFIRCNERPYHATGIFNFLAAGGGLPGNAAAPVKDGESFSAAVSYLGTYLDRRGYTFDYVNSFKAGQNQLAEKLKQQNILTIAVTTTLYISVLPLLEIMSFIKNHNTSAKVIIGGPFIATQCRVADEATLEYLFNSIGADIYVNSSQGEAALVNIIDALKKNKSLDTIKNIHYKANGRYNKTPLLRENNKLSENMVKWALFSDGPGQYVNLRTTISCPFSCSFCGFPEHAGKYQTVEPAAVETELNQLRQIPSVKCLHFIDDTFNVPVNRFKSILRMLVKNRYGFKWHSQLRCQFIDRDAVELLKESGCEGVFLGIESGSDQILANMNKAASIKDYLKGIELLKKYGILTYGSFIIGFPGETYETARDTVKFIENSGIDFYRTQLWYCDPLTPIYRRREKDHIKGSNFEWSHATMNSKGACDLIDNIFLSVKNSTWLPQYGFDFTTIFHLTNRGISPGKARNFIRSFNRGLEEKLLHPNRNEVSPGVMNRLKNSLIYEDVQFDHMETHGKNKKIPGGDIVIDFDLD
jgi:radical SAM PhpK family P-methyltransferase